jgi:hypothetical protein
VPNPKETSIGALLSGAAVAVGSAVSLADATVDDIAVANRLPAPGWDPYGWWMSLSEDPPYDAPNGAQPTRPTIRAFFSNHPGEVSKGCRVAITKATFTINRRRSALLACPEGVRRARTTTGQGQPTSTDLRIAMPSSPPTTRRLPSGSRVVVWLARGWCSGVQALNPEPGE